MKKSLKMAALAAFIGAAALTARAQTNVVESLGIQLIVFSQGVFVTNGTRVIQNAAVTRMGTRDVIQILGTATTNDFSKAAQLLCVTAIVDGTNGGTTTVVKDGTNMVDVSGFFSITGDGAVVRNSVSKDGHLLDATRYRIRKLALVNQAGYPDLTAHLSVQGFDVATIQRVVFKDGLVVDGRYATWTVNGTGDKSGKPAVVEGEITVNFVKEAVGTDL